MEKRYNSRCMYGNYKPSEELYGQSGPRHHFRHKKLVWAVFVALAALFLIFLVGCKPKQVIVEKEKLVYVTKDSIVHRDSTIYVPVERYVDIVPIYDTLLLSTSISESRSWVDTTNHILRGELKNKNAIQHQVKYIERVIKNDSIVERKVPQPYPVVEEKIKRPWWSWICLTWTIISLISIGWTIYKRLRH